MSDIEGQTTIPAVEAAVSRPKRVRKTRMIWVAPFPFENGVPVIDPSLQATTQEQVLKNIRERMAHTPTGEPQQFLLLKEAGLVSIARRASTVVKVS